MDREFKVVTPLGNLRVYSKSEIDCAQDFPGVYVDLIAEDGTSELLACVEYDSMKRVMQTCAYQPDVAAGPVAKIEHRLLVKKPRKQIVPCDLAIKRFYRMYVEVDEGAGTDQVIAAAKQMVVESSNPDSELCPDPDIYSEIESQDICWVNPNWDGAHYKDEDEEVEL